MNTDKNKRRVLFAWGIVALVVIAFLCSAFLIGCDRAEEVVEEPPLKKVRLDMPITYDTIAYVSFETRVKATAHRELVVQHITKLDARVSSGKYMEDAKQAMIDERNRLQGIVTKLDADIAKFEKCETEYYYSAMVWQTLRDQGFSEVIVAAIIGNMMVETNPYCLEIEPYDQHKSGCHYGLCQWARKYYKEVMGASFEDQLAFLVKTMPKEFNRYGRIYKTGFNYEAFLKMTDTKKAALAFAMIYERCGKGSYPARQTCAKMAYEYFVNGIDTTPYAK